MGSESAPLLVGHRGGRGQPNYNSSPFPPDEDRSVWARYTAHTLHVARSVLFHNWVNVLLVFVPLGIVSGAVGWSPTVVFTLNFLAIIPLASLLSFATEELAAKLGQTIGGLLNATFGNAVELIVSLIL